MATVNLGSIKFKWKGTYAGGTAYTIDDVVSYNGSSYICILASTGNLPTNATYFEQMSSAGTNGTDLTTTLTTQGDLVYRDGSGLVRLGAGTAGQVLQTGGAGANPSWGTVSSDFVKLAEATDVNTASYSLDGYYSSTYLNYKLVFTGLRTTTNTALFGRVRISNADSNSSSYKFAVIQIYTEAGSTSNGIVTSGWNTDYFRLNGDNLANVHGGVMSIDIFDPLGTGSNKYLNTDITYIRFDNATHQRQVGGVSYFDNVAHSGITIYSGTGNFKAETMRLYGIK
jgi:hypothetical protein